MQKGMHHCLCCPDPILNATCFKSSLTHSVSRASQMAHPQFLRHTGLVFAALALFVPIGPLSHKPTETPEQVDEGCGNVLLMSHLLELRSRKIQGNVGFFGCWAKSWDSQTGACFVGFPLNTQQKGWYPDGAGHPNSWFLLGNILHFCSLWFSGKSPLNCKKCFFCSPSNVNQDLEPHPMQRTTHETPLFGDALFFGSPFNTKGWLAPGPMNPNTNRRPR